MCVISMVMDHYLPKIPAPSSSQWTWIEAQPSAKAEIEELKKVIADFKKAVDAAKKVDALTNQPDCVDPEKAKLLDRVSDLERRIAAVERKTKRKR